MSAIGQLNLRCCGGSWDGELRRPKSCFVKEGFKLVDEAGYGRTVSNIQGKGIPNDDSSYRKTAMDDGETATTSLLLPSMLQHCWLVNRKGHYGLNKYHSTNVKRFS